MKEGTKIYTKISDVKVPQTITSIGFSSTGNNFAIGLDTGWIYIYQVNSEEILQKKPIFANNINCITWSKDDKYIVACSNDSKLILLNTLNFKIVREYFGSLEALFACDISLYNDMIAAGGADTLLHLWSTSSSQQIHYTPAHNEIITSVHFNSSGKFILTSSIDGLCRIFDTNNLFLLRTYTANSYGITYSLFSPSEKFILVTTTNNKLFLIDISNGLMINSYNNSNSDETNIRNSITICYNNPNVELIVASESNNIMCYNAINRKILWNIKLESDPNSQLMIGVSKDAEFVVTAVDNSFTVYKRKNPLDKN